jgi:hypothetical protein
MKSTVRHLLPLVLVFLLATGFTSRPAGDDAEVKIDGKLVRAESVLSFDRDDTVYLEATGIKPNSTIRFKVKKAGIKWFEDVYDVDKSGEVKGVMHIPEEKLTVTCEVEYYSSDNTYHEVKFKFKTV